MKSDDTLPRVTSPRMYNDGNITFEGLMVVFASFSTYLQYLNIYRSVWWLPNSNYTLWVRYSNIIFHYYSVFYIQFPCSFSKLNIIKLL